MSSAFPLYDSLVMGSCPQCLGPWLPGIGVLLLPPRPWWIRVLETAKAGGVLCLGVFHFHVDPQHPGLWDMNSVRGIHLVKVCGTNSSDPCACHPQAEEVWFYSPVCSIYHPLSFPRGRWKPFHFFFIHLPHMPFLFLIFNCLIM